MHSLLSQQGTHEAVCQRASTVSSRRSSRGDIALSRARLAGSRLLGGAFAECGLAWSRKSRLLSDLHEAAPCMAHLALRSVGQARFRGCASLHESVPAAWQDRVGWGASWHSRALGHDTVHGGWDSSQRLGEMF